MSTIQNLKHTLHMLEVEEYQLNELTEQRKKQAEIERQIEAMAGEFEERARQIQRQRDDLVLQNRLSREERDREIAEEEAQLQAHYAAIEARVKDEEYAQRAAAQKKRQADEQRAQWLEEELERRKGCSDVEVAEKVSVLLCDANPVTPPPLTDPLTSLVPAKARIGARCKELPNIAAYA